MIYEAINWVFGFKQTCYSDTNINIDQKYNKAMHFLFWLK